MSSTGLTLRFCLAVFFFLGLAGLPGHSWGVEYTLTPFTVGDAATVYAYGISNDGTVVGNADYAAFVKGVSVTPLGGGGFSEAYGISPNGGQVVGYDGRSFSYQKSTTITSYPPLSIASSTLDVWPGAGARGVNDSGTIVGYGGLSGSTTGFKIEGGTLSALAFTGWTDIMAFGINNSGVIVGQGTYNGIAQAFRSTGSSSAAPLSSPAGIMTAAATGINSLGQTVGYGFDGDGNARSFVCDSKGCNEITSNGWSLLQVYGLNDSGKIVGVGQDSGGAQVAFTGVASAAPSPAPLYAYFSGYGLYSWDSTTWTQIGESQPLNITASGSLLYATFSGVNGIYKFDGSTWTKLGDTAPAMLAASGSMLYGYYTGYGLYSFDGTTWTQLGTSQPLSITASGSLLYATFSGVNGIYKWDGSAWTKFGDTAPASINASGSLLYAYFSGYGLYKWDGTTWIQIGTSQPLSLTASSSALYATFSGVNGIYKFDGSTWTTLGDTPPAMLAASGSMLYGYYTGYGLYSFNGTTWTQLGTSQPASMTSGD